MLDGKQYLVVPVVAIREGVLNGVYVTSAEIEKSLPSWNGRPIPLSHPMQNGQPISANSPRVVERDVIGNLYNVNFAGLLNDSTSYNGFSLVGNTGNITCGVRVYGYRQA